MLGTLAEARLAYSIVREDGCQNMPQGWERLGSGCDRVGMLAPSGVVYKVQHSKGYDANYNEFMMIMLIIAQALVPADLGIRMPLVTRYDVAGEVVLAMEFIDDNGGGQYNPMSPDGMVINVTPEQRKFAMSVLRIPDVHSGNFRMDSDGNIVFIDYGFADSWRAETDDERDARMAAGGRGW